MRKTGYKFFGGEAFKSSSAGTSGNGAVAVRARTHLQAKARQHFVVEGCGYCAVELRVKGVSLLFLSLYLKTSTPLHCHPNAEILASVIALIKEHYGQWLVAGDFNLRPQELVQTALVEELGGQILCTGESTVHTGGESYFAVFVGHVSIKADWSAPHRPQASVLFEVRLPGSQERSLKLPDFQVRDACEKCRFKALSVKRLTV